MQKVKATDVTFRTEPGKGLADFLRQVGYQE
jgi:hypothetical protein